MSEDRGFAWIREHGHTGSWGGEEEEEESGLSSKCAIGCNKWRERPHMPTFLTPMQFSWSALPLFISFAFSHTPAPRMAPLLSRLDCSLGIGQPLMAVIGGNQGTCP